MVLARPREAWLKLYNLLVVDATCEKRGPENTDPEIPKGQNNIGQLLEGGTMEHLAHVVFGNQTLKTKKPRMKAICDQFIDSKQCPGSPCIKI